MARSVSFGDAVRLLGSHDSALLGALDTAAGWLMVGAAPLVQDVLGWFDYKADLSRLCREAVRGFYEFKTGLSKHGRTERIEAAHTVLVIAAFFDELKEVRLPTSLAKTEQIALATSGAAMPDKFVTLIMSAGRLLPAEGQAPEDFERGLHDYYRSLVGKVNNFLDGLAVSKKLHSAERERITEALNVVADQAVSRYRDSMLELAKEPDFESWTQILHHRATRAAVFELRDSLTAITAMLRDRYAGQEPDELRDRLTKTYIDGLRTRSTDVGPLPDDVRVPSLDELYVVPRFRIMEMTGPRQVGDDARWDAQDLRADSPWEFLGDYLRSDRAVKAPMCLVGEAGSGTTSFLRLVSAVLPPESFLLLRVDMKRKPELTEIEDHLAEALRTATGEAPDWSSLVPLGRAIQRVVALDSFDEYLQATGTDQANLLERVAEFQRRESIRDRPVAVIVTGRAAVLDRARPPDGTLAVRLEPFEEPQVREWIAGWNTVNPKSPLTPEALLTHRDLTRQPLLLLVLAVHAAHRRPIGSRHEHVLGVLADREVMKYHPQLHQRELITKVDLNILAAAAFATFDRGDVWISEPDLGQALADAGTAPDSSLPTVAYLLARFPFRRHGQKYAFVHPAVADVLVARLIWNELRKIEDGESAMPKAGATDEGLRTLLSRRLLVHRRAVIDFLIEMMTELGPSASRKFKDLLVHLFRDVRSAPAPSELGGALIYRANLLQLLVCAPTEAVLASELFPDSPEPIEQWRAQAMLWESQLSSANMRALVSAFTVERIEENGMRDVRIGPAQDGWAPAAIHPAWSSDRAVSPQPSWADLHLRTNFLCDPFADVMLHTAEPLLRLDATGGYTSAMALWELSTAPSLESCKRCVQIAVSESGTPGTRLQFLELLLPHLSASGHLTGADAAEALRRLDESLRPHLPPLLRTRMIECLSSRLDHGGDEHKVAEVLGSMLMPDLADVEPVPAALALIRIYERGLPRPAVRQLTSVQDFDAMVREVTAQRPDLERRLAPLVPEAASRDGKAG
ncbi:NACHT domain-containing protein [Amycolatopsis sp. NPDC003865]